MIKVHRKKNFRSYTQHEYITFISWFYIFARKVLFLLMFLLCWVIIVLSLPDCKYVSETQLLGNQQCNTSSHPKNCGLALIKSQWKNLERIDCLDSSFFTVLKFGLASPATILRKLHFFPTTGPLFWKIDLRTNWTQNKVVSGMVHTSDNDE